MSETPPLLTVAGLSLSRGSRQQLANLSFSLQSGETRVLLGEIGSGKEAVLQALAGYSVRSEDFSGSFSVRGQPPFSVTRLKPDALRVVYLAGPAVLPLSPHVGVIAQLSRVISRKLSVPLATGRTEFASALHRLKGAPPLDVFEQRAGALDPEVLVWALFAAAFAQTPELLIADDPMLGLGPTQAHAMIDILREEQKRAGFALLYATMNTEAVLWLNADVTVLRQGKVVEEGAVARLSGEQAHVYTKTLFRAAPRLALGDNSPRSDRRTEPVIQAHGLEFDTNGAREAVTFELRRGASLALVGDRQSGRHALMRAALGLDRIAAGRVILDAVDIGILTDTMLTRLRRRVAFISGDEDVLDPRMTLWDTVSEPLRAHLNLPRNVVAEAGEAALKRVGLATLKSSAPVSALSPFDKRRLQVARAIVSAPLLAVIDEPLRGLDAFAQSVMRDLLKVFRQQEGPALIVITSDFTVAQALAEDVMVFKEGKIVDRGPISEVLRSPRDAHTRQLIDAVLARPAGL